MLVIFRCFGGIVNCANEHCDFLRHFLGQNNLHKTARFGDRVVSALEANVGIGRRNLTTFVLELLMSPLKLDELLFVVLFLALLKTLNEVLHLKSSN